MYPQWWLGNAYELANGLGKGSSYGDDESDLSSDDYSDPTGGSGWRSPVTASILASSHPAAHFSLGISGGTLASHLASLSDGSQSSANPGNPGHYSAPLAHPLSSVSNPYNYTFDETSARADAQRAGSAAMVAGLLNSYLNHGQGAGDAFLLERKAYDQSMSDAEDSARQQALDKAKAAEWTQQEQDRQAQEQDRQDARQERIKVEQGNEQATRQKLAAAQALQSSADSIVAAHPEYKGLPPEEVVKSYAAHLTNADKQDNLPDKYVAIPESGRMLNPQTGKVINYGQVTSAGSEGAGGKVTPQQFLTMVDDEAANMVGPQTNPLTKISIPADQYHQKVQSARPLAEATVRQRLRSIGVNVPSNQQQADPVAAKKLSAVTDPAVQAKIAAARSHHYTDPEIVEFLGL
jgi:hypothetical protein